MYVADGTVEWSGERADLGASSSTGKEPCTSCHGRCCVLSLLRCHQTRECSKRVVTMSVAGLVYFGSNSTCFYLLLTFWTTSCTTSSTTSPELEVLVWSLFLHFLSFSSLTSLPLFFLVFLSLALFSPRLFFLSPSIIPSLSVHFSPFFLSSRTPEMKLGVVEECCKLPQCQNWILCILALEYDTRWQQF